MYGILVTVREEIVLSCHITMFIQIPTFERTIILQRMAMDWLVSHF